ncbi:hypothetical protein C8R45DRAFT_1209469 [Mycena sanguinolenta]|nr:hypothetical protein C8R45DRAFT_1209469 [Mycena sanguinolenta]
MCAVRCTRSLLASFKTTMLLSLAFLVPQLVPVSISVPTPGLPHAVCIRAVPSIRIRAVLSSSKYLRSNGSLANGQAAAASRAILCFHGTSKQDFTSSVAPAARSSPAARYSSSSSTSPEASAARSLRRTPAAPRRLRVVHRHGGIRSLTATRVIGAAVPHVLSNALCELLSVLYLLSLSIRIRFKKSSLRGTRPNRRSFALKSNRGRKIGPIWKIYHHNGINVRIIDRRD